MSSNGQAGTHGVRIGGVIVGEGAAVVLAQGHEADVRWLSLRGVAGPGAVARARAGWDGPLLVEPGSAADLAEIAEHADGVVIETGDPLARAAAALGLPVVVLRAPGTGLDDWLDAAARCAAEGAAGVVLCEGVGETGGPDLALVRAARRSGRPVLAAPGEDAGLAGAAVAAGADGLWLAPGADAEAVATAREAVTVVGALVREERPSAVPAARQAIDRVDAALAVLLERRAALAGTIQRLKPVGGFAGRDMDRERRLVAAMARRAPRLGEARLAPIMNAVIEGGLHLAEELRAAARENGREPSNQDQADAQALAGGRPHHD
ncbi:chorismate mutase [Sphaerisporangium fuscum]|uniref:chorismate mutase n=1 Tax=Sphaerisporangium fuscum TaxID=2835868 RepID=UPI001BDC636B|nr:chorismate mutase [Sphaerisporangium fuscum]